MRANWGAIVILALVAAIIAYKTTHQKVTSPQGTPRVLLVADFSEADSADPCADIIRSVRAARARGVRVAELNPDSKSEMMSRYHVLTVPTVLILYNAGVVKSRFEGENLTTVAAVSTELAKLK
jgi:thioredoxin-like negative regulator of GroEL